MNNANIATINASLLSQIGIVEQERDSLQELLKAEKELVKELKAENDKHLKWTETSCFKEREEMFDKRSEQREHIRGLEWQWLAAQTERAQQLHKEKEGLQESLKAETNHLDRARSEFAAERKLACRLSKELSEAKEELLAANRLLTNVKDVLEQHKPPW